MRFETIAVAATIGVTLLAGAGTTSAQQMTAEFFPDKDATLIEEPLGNASGSSTAIFIGTVGGFGSNSERRALISFDIGGSSIPSDATITDATLTLFLERGGGAASTITLHRLLVDWGEGPSTMGRGQGELAVTGDSTWDDRFYMESAWTASGAEADTDYVASASADQSVSALAASVDVIWSDLATDVEFWLDNPESNFGWIMIGSTKGGSAKRFSSREAIADQRPLLSVTYEVPEPAAVWAGLTAFATLAALRARRGPYRR